MSDKSPAAAPSSDTSAAMLSANGFSRLTLLLLGAVWAGLGIAGLFYPDTPSALVGIDLESRSARSEYRAVFGGVPAALAVAHILAATRAAWLRPGLLTATALVVGLLSGRVVSLAVDGVPGPVAWVLMGAEVFMLVLCVAGLWRLQFRST